MKRYLQPDTPSLPTTWKHNGVVHEVSHVTSGGSSFIDNKWRWLFRTACGINNAVDDRRAFVSQRAIDCMLCLAVEPPMPAMFFGNPCAEVPLRGLTADRIIIDEVQDFIAEPGLLKKP